MADSLSSWRKRLKKTIVNYSVDYLSSEFCFRDPLRPIKNNSKTVYSPADGIIIGISNLVSVSEPICTKMGMLSLSSLSHNMIVDNDYICITIFLTFYDPHIIRMPFDGIITRKDLPPFYVQDLPMLDFENMILNNRKNEIKRTIVSKFAFNQRTLFEIHNVIDGYKSYLLLTADYDIDTILSFFVGGNRPIKQGQRIGQIRYGSMATLIIPSQSKLIPCVKELTHVEAGLDPVFYKNE